LNDSGPIVLHTDHSAGLFAPIGLRERNLREVARRLFTFSVFLLRGAVVNVAVAYKFTNTMKSARNAARFH
jgi:hypothetical protein